MMAPTGSALVETERDKYADVWDCVDAYGAMSPGLEVLPIFESLVPAPQSRSLLDAGCGAGRAGLALADRGFRVTLCDLTDAGLAPEARERLPFVSAVLWRALPTQGTGWWFDYVYCCDVLEHLPTAYVGLAIRRLLEVTAAGAFFSVSFVPDHFGAWAGAPLHQTVQPYGWWRDLFAELGTVLDARDLGSMGTFYVREATR